MRQAALLNGPTSNESLPRTTKQEGARLAILRNQVRPHRFGLGGKLLVMQLVADGALDCPSVGAPLLEAPGTLP